MSQATPQKSSFRTLYAGQQVQHLRQRARLIQVKKKRAEILKVIDANPEVMVDLQTTLEGLGYKFATSAAALAIDDKPKAQGKTSNMAGDELPNSATTEDDTSLGDLSGGTGSTDDKTSRIRTGCGIKDSNPQNWVSHKYTTFENSRLPFLTDIMGAGAGVVQCRRAARHHRQRKQG